MRSLFCIFQNLKFKIVLSLFLSLVCSQVAWSYGGSGKYLVAIQAASKNDFRHASKNYLSLLKGGISETLIIQEALLFSVLANDFVSAQKISMTMENRELKLPTVGLISLTMLYKNREYHKIENLISHFEKTLPTYLLTLVRGWSDLAQGSFDNGIIHFASLSGTSRYLGLYNSALAFAMVGEFQKALSFLEELDEQKVQFDEIQLQVIAQIYSNNNLNQKAIEIIEAHEDMRKIDTFESILVSLEKDQKLQFNVIESPGDALANIFYLMGSSGDKTVNKSLSAMFYIQLAEFLATDKDYYTIKLARIFADLDAFDYSIAKLESVRPGSAFFLKAQLGIADSLVRSKESSAAQTVLENLIEKGYDNFVVFDSLADIFRTNENYEKAINYYNTALKNLPEAVRSSKWTTFFVRGISYDQMGNWAKAKVDLKIALELSANHPEVLNYFGYSLIERKESLESALEMIENAVSQRPESGYIVDSLAWGLFRLGLYKEAVVPMERAIQLEPHDPIVNDHLGDVLWMIGRKREAMFQWQRALFFGPTVENEKKIRKKLKFGITDL